MFIDTLEFTIPIDLCALYATLQEEAKSQLEFPASVNSYGTTQDANVQVALRANKVTFKVDGVSSNASIISKSECKTLKLSVFDVDRSLMQKNVNNSHNSVQQTSPVSNANKRFHEQSVSLPPAKSSRTSYGESPRPRSPPNRNPHSHPSSRPSPNSNSQSKSHNDTPVNVKQEPEDPDLIEIEPDPEPDDIVPKKETPYMQIDYSSNEPHTQTSQAAFDRVSFPPTSRSQSSSSSFHQNVPHVQDYGQPGPSHGDQSAEDFLVFQDDNECNDDFEDAEYSNDDSHGIGNANFVESGSYTSYNADSNLSTSQGFGYRHIEPSEHGDRKLFPCPECDKVFNRKLGLKYHIQAIHQKKVFPCVCGKVYKHRPSIVFHWRTCAVYQSQKKS